MEICIKWSICRICTGDNRSQLQSIFDDTRLADQLLEYAELVVQPMDGLPDQICSDCVKNLQLVHTFLTTCKRVDAHLKNVVRRTMSARKCFPNGDSNNVDFKNSTHIKAETQEIHEHEQSISKKQPKKVLNTHLQKSVFLTDQEELVSEKEVIQHSNSFLEDLELASTAQSSENSLSSTTEKNNEDDIVDSKRKQMENEDNEFNTTDEADNDDVADYDIDDKKNVIEHDCYNAGTEDLEAAITTKHYFAQSKSKPKLPSVAAPLDVDLTAFAPLHLANHNCTLCGNAFPNSSQLKSHMRSHRNERSYECELCSKRFNAACNLTTHMRTHTGEKPYGCVHCGRRFADRSTHRKHERMHTNERPYSCGICGKNFSLSTTLKAHALSHSKEKPHQCVTCKKGFRLPHQLKAHEKTHVHRYEVDFLLYK